MILSHRRAKGTGIPIVPMLDILTILLIFFIVHTEFKRQVSVLNLQVPQTRHLAGERGDTDDLLLELDAEGRAALGGVLVPQQELAAVLRQRLLQQPQLRVQVSAAQGISMGRFVEVMDLLSAAGIQAEDVPVRIEPKEK